MMLRYVHAIFGATIGPLMIAGTTGAFKFIRQLIASASRMTDRPVSPRATIRRDQIPRHGHRHCLEKPFLSRTEGADGHGRGVTCQCLVDIVNRAPP
jgi:hypothetical protein